MDTEEEYAWRVSRLQALLSEVFNGNVTHCAKALGFQGPAYVRQLLSGKRPITEKTIAKWRGLPVDIAAYFRKPDADVARLIRRLETRHSKYAEMLAEELDQVPEPDRKRAYFKASAAITKLLRQPPKPVPQSLERAPNAHDDAAPTPAPPAKSRKPADRNRDPS